MNAMDETKRSSPHPLRAAPCDDEAAPDSPGSPGRFLRVAICDDDPATRSDVQALLSEYAQLHAVNMAVSAYESAEALLAARDAFDVLFLDIYMDGMDGTEAAWRLSAEERERTVFLTTSESHAVEAFQLGAAHYLLKPVTLEDVSETLRRCIPGKEVPADVLVVRTTDGTVPIPMASIRTIEARDKVCAITATDGDWRAYASLGSLEGQLDGRCFLRVHRSYIVNMRRIKTLYHDRVVMDDGTAISVGRGRQQEARRRYQDFMFALARGELS